MEGKHALCSVLHFVLPGYPGYGQKRKYEKREREKFNFKKYKIYDFLNSPKEREREKKSKSYYKMISSIRHGI